MQSLSYHVGKWRAEALLEEFAAGQLMAVISVMDDKGSLAGRSRHTVVFDHEAGKDKREEIESLVQRLLRERYGV